MRRRPYNNVGVHGHDWGPPSNADTTGDGYSGSGTADLMIQGNLWPEYETRYTQVRYEDSMEDDV